MTSFTDHDRAQLHRIEGVNARILASLDRIERFLIEQMEYKSLGHRVVYDRKTGISRIGGHCDPALLDDHGFQVRLGK